MKHPPAASSRLLHKDGFLTTYMLAVLFLISGMAMTLYTREELLLLAAMNLKEADRYLCTEAVVLSRMRCLLQQDLPKTIQESYGEVSFEAERTSYGYTIHVQAPIQEEILLEVEEKSRRLQDYDTVRSVSTASISSIS